MAAIDRDPISRRGRSAGRGRLLFAAGLLVGVLAASLAQRLRRDPGLELLRQVRALAAETFVREVPPRQLVDDAAQGMLGGLDRYSRYYGEEEIAALDRETSGEFHGIGVVFRPPVSEARILFAFPDSPAARAGLGVGDTILEVDGIRVAEMAPGALQSHIRSAGPRTVRLVVRDLAGEERGVDVTPERIVDPTVRHARLVDPHLGVGYLAVVSFSHRTPGEFDAALEELRPEGLRALIVDLRGNPGGILDAATLLANRFVREGRLVATRTRQLTQETSARAEEATCAGMPLVVLVDAGSASASEVLAGALQDHGAAALVGEPTYGKGTVQTITSFAEYAARVKITTATYYTPAWRRIERNGEDGREGGIVPDVVVPLDAAARTAVYAHLATYPPPAAALPAIRAWEEREGIELVASPPPDAQLDAALALLRGERPAGAASEGE
ncbi:MAG: S41 family peptidase [Planctomycetota bacterium]